MPSPPPSGTSAGGGRERKSAVRSPATTIAQPLPSLISPVPGAETGYGASERRPGTGFGAEFATTAHQPRPRGGDRLWSK